MQNTVGADSVIRNAQAYLGPNRSQAAPMTSLEKMLPETEPMAAFPISVFVRLRLSRIIGTRGAAAKVETKQVKNEIQDRWKVLMCGLAKEKILKTLDLCSESTGKTNFAVESVGIVGSEATEKANVCSLPVTPCMELPGEFSSPPIITQFGSLKDFLGEVEGRFIYII